MMTTINKKQKRVLLAAIIFAAGITVVMLVLANNTPQYKLSYNCFKTQQGWGYDVLVNEKIIIHQPFIPGETGIAGFSNQQQAAVAARIVIEKIKSGEIPAITHQ